MRGFLKASDFYQVFPFTKKIHLLSDEFNPPSSPQKTYYYGGAKTRKEKKKRKSKQKTKNKKRNKRNKRNKTRKKMKN